MSVRQSGAGIGVTEAGFTLPGYDYVENTTPGTDTMTLVFRHGGEPKSTGSIVAQVTVVFTDVAHSDLITATRDLP